MTIENIETTSVGLAPVGPTFFSGNRIDLKLFSKFVASFNSKSS
jgi:hypothetical protein